MSGIFKKEPALIIAGIMAALTVAVVFGLPLTGEQQDAIESALWAIVPLILVTGAVTRQSVYAPANVVATTSDKPGVAAVAGPASPLANDTPVAVTPA